MMRFLSVLLFSIILIPSSFAASGPEIEVYVDEALESFYKQTSAGKKLAQRAKGVLVFPKVYKAGFGVGGEYGEGALRIGGKTVGYYSIASGSFGFQLGAQRKSEILLFMTEESLNQFKNSDGWEAGVDGSVAIATVGAGGNIDTHTATQPIIGFIFSNKGLMYNLTIEGSKISHIKR